MVGSIAEQQLCGRELSETVMLHRIYLGLQYGWMEVDYRLSLLGKDLHPDKIDHVLLPADDEEKAVFIDSSEITGRKPAICQDIFPALPGRVVGVQHPLPLD